MSDPMWVGVGIGDAVGTATIDTAGEFTITAHGLVDDQPVRLDTLTAGAVAAFDEDTTYYVVNAAADTFDLVSIPGDTVITLGSSGGADVHTAVPHYSAPELRRADSITLFGGTSDAFGARQGVRPGHIPASVSGTTWTVGHLTAVVYPALASTDGPYRVQHEAENGSLDPADGANDRIDALDLQIQDDDEDASGFRRARVVYVVGTPAGSPSAPGVTTNSLRVATVLVPAGGSPSPSLTIVAPLTVASGGVLPVRDDTELPSSSLYDGMIAHRQDLGQPYVRVGSAWELVSPWRILAEGDAASVASVLLSDIGGYSWYQLRLRGSLDDTALLLLQINGGIASNTGFVANRASDGAVLDDFHSSSATTWRIAQWSSAVSCNAVIDITNVPADTANLIGYDASGTRNSGNEALHSFSRSGGRINTSSVLDSITISRLSPSSQFDDIHWRLLGSR